MSAEKNFRGESLTFLFVFEGLFLFLYGVFGFVFAVLAWCSMLFCVKFNVGMREVRMMPQVAVWMLVEGLA